MKRMLAGLFALLLAVSFVACKKQPDAVILTDEELQNIKDNLSVGDELNLDGYTDEQKDQIKDALDKDGYELEDQDGTIVLKPQNPLDDETLDQILNDAQNNGSLDLDDYDEAQKDQIKDKLEQEGLAPAPDKDETGNTPIVTIPELTEQEIDDIFNEWGITDDSVFPEDYEQEIHVSSYPQKQIEQLKQAAGLLGLDWVEEGGKVYLRAMEIHMDYVTDNPNE